MGTTKHILELLADHEAEEKWKETVVKGAQYDYLKETLTKHTDDAEVNARNATTWDAITRALRDPARRSFKYATEMTASELAAEAVEDGRVKHGRFVLNNHDIGALTSRAGKPDSPEMGFLLAQIKQAQAEGRVIANPQHRWPNETEDARVERLQNLIVDINTAMAANDQCAEVAAKLTEMAAGGAEVPERRSYLNRKLAGLEKQGKAEAWGDRSIALDGLPGHQALERAGAALTSEGGGE